jgi:hypothetical protein
MCVIVLVRLFVISFCEGSEGAYLSTSCGVEAKVVLSYAKLKKEGRI